jgi:hypothetical protein
LEKNGKFLEIGKIMGKFCKSKNNGKFLEIGK